MRLVCSVCVCTLASLIVLHAQVVIRMRLLLWEFGGTATCVHSVLPCLFYICHYYWAAWLFIDDHHCNSRQRAMECNGEGGRSTVWLAQDLLKEPTKVRSTPTVCAVGR